RAQPQQQHKKQVSFVPKEDARKKALNPSTSSFVAGCDPAPVPVNKKWPCLFCDSSEHNFASCKEVPLVDARLTILRKKFHCFKCICPRHAARTCISQVQCKVCKQNHHVAVCRNGRPAEPPTAQASEGVVVVASALQSNPPMPGSAIPRWSSLTVLLTMQIQ